MARLLTNIHRPCGSRFYLKTYFYLSMPTTYITKARHCSGAQCQHC
uniref:Uncharacterized protein n=1 Tax=Anguilla anguilla TaxID=7936 RepID=A0A0E9XHB1_ANGAN